MSIRKVTKDHLKEHAGVTLVGPQRIEPPSSGDPLVFWTRHPKTPREVDLRPFAKGQANGQSGRNQFEPFSGRPELIIQLLPALKEALVYLAATTVINYCESLRAWWRVLDSVEADAAERGETMTRVEDVRLLTNMHADAAYRRDMPRIPFMTFRALVDVTCIALGAKQTYWETPEKNPKEKHIPPENQRKALRIEVKRQCRQVLSHWARCDELKALSTSPEDPEIATLWRAVQHMHAVQQRTGKVLPTSEALNNNGCQAWTHNNLGLGLQLIRATAFPDHHDADAVWSQCLINTPWNPSTLLSLDATKRFLFDHFKDDPADPHRRWVLSTETYQLIGEKERAGGKEQFVVGMWKTKDGPGHLIKTYLARVEPLREVLKVQLVEAKQRYKEMQGTGEASRKVSALYARIVEMERGCRSVWLFVNQKGEIAWLGKNNGHSGYADGTQVAYLEEVRHHLNAKRVEQKEEPIPEVWPKEFRIWFADYVYRASHGSIMAVKNALNHSQLRTSVGYVNTNILNQAASDSARRFLEILVDELDKGRVDLTILAHFYRHGPLTPEQEQRLAAMRTLPKSRQGVGCKDARHPPAHLKATPGGACDNQRCLLCIEHAVLLPESLDGIVMREAELRALQCFLPATTWVEDRFDIELENHKQALRRFDLNQVMAARKKWAQAIACGEHLVPGAPVEELPPLMELA